MAIFYERGLFLYIKKYLLYNVNMKEVWKPIPNLEKFYLVSNLGRFKSLGNRAGASKSEKILKLKVMHDGYLYARLSNNGKQIFVNAHRIVAKVFIPNPENKKEVNHINLIKDDNRVSNLEWVTPKENLKHAVNSRGEWRGRGRTVSLKIKGYYFGMTKTKEGKREYMQQYRLLKNTK